MSSWSCLSASLYCLEAVPTAYWALPSRCLQMLLSQSTFTKSYVVNLIVVFVILSHAVVVNTIVVVVVIACVLIVAVVYVVVAVVNTVAVIVVVAVHVVVVVHVVVAVRLSSLMGCWFPEVHLAGCCQRCLRCV